MSKYYICGDSAKAILFWRVWYVSILKACTISERSILNLARLKINLSSRIQSYCLSRVKRITLQNYPTHLCVAEKADFLSKINKIPLLSLFNQIPYCNWNLIHYSSSEKKTFWLSYWNLRKNKVSFIPTFKKLNLKQNHRKLSVVNYNTKIYSLKMCISIFFYINIHWTLVVSDNFHKSVDFNKTFDALLWQVDTCK